MKDQQYNNKRKFFLKIFEIFKVDKKKLFNTPEGDDKYLNYDNKKGKKFVVETCLKDAPYEDNKGNSNIKLQINLIVSNICQRTLNYINA